MMYGFNIIKEEFLNEINSNGKLLHHKKSGMKIFHLKNKDNNRFFSITFKTPVYNDKGIPHILEHSIIRGYDKYSDKNIFLELSKGSTMNFFDASTFSDKTMYSFSSNNNAEFLKLVDIFLGMTFFSNVSEKPKVFLQEGWHYEYDKNSNKLLYNGIVLNEMKNKFTNSKVILNEKIKKSLFETSPYRFKSDGVPNNICKATFKEVIDFYKHYYTPNNSYVFLYGDIYLDKALELIDNKYLSLYKYKALSHTISFDNQFHIIKKSCTVYKCEHIKNNIMSLNFVIGTCTDPELTMTIDILKDIIFEDKNSIIKKDILTKEYCNNIYCRYNTSMLQPIFSIIFEGVKLEKQKELIELFYKSLINISNQKIDRKQLEATINKKRFEFNEMNNSRYPLGFIYNTKFLKSWIYDDDPFTYFKYEKVMNKIISSSNQYFKEIIEKYFIKNSHMSKIMLVPKDSTEERKQFFANFDENKDIFLTHKKVLESNEFINKNNLDSNNGLDNLIRLKDTYINNEIISPKKTNTRGTEILEYNINTNGIVYIDMFFDLKTVPQRLIPYINILSYIVGNIDTNKYKLSDLISSINYYTGGIKCSTEVYTDSKKIDEYYPKFVIRTKFLSYNLINTIDLLREIICNLQFSNVSNLKKIIHQIKYEIEDSFAKKGHEYIAYRTMSYFSPIGMYLEDLKGFNFYAFLKCLEYNFDKEIDKILMNLQLVKKNIFNKNNLLVSIVGSEEDCEKLKEKLNTLLYELNDDFSQIHKYSFNFEQKNEGIICSNKVQSVAKVYNFKYFNYSYKGHMKVLINILNTDYLYKNIRIKNGAYGFYNELQKMD